MNALWGWVRYPFYAGSSLFGLGSAALYYYQKYSCLLKYNQEEFTDSVHSEIIYPRNIPPGARTDVPRPAQYGIEDHEELSIPTPDGETLSAFLLRPSNKAQARPVTILAFHGNAGNIGHRLPIGRVLTNDVNCTVLMLEYRGYGLSTGTPNEQGLVIDAQTGLDYIRSREDLKNNKIVIFGQSIGGAVAIDLVSKNQVAGDVKGLILENTFLSIAKMIPNAVPVAKWLTPFCHEYWRSEEMIPKITKVPILFLSGLQDEIVPYVLVSSFTTAIHALTRPQTKPHEATIPFVQNQDCDVEGAAIR
jgi:fermentation-respiration switch protein FrsA (DUF1100 family)